MTPVIAQVHVEILAEPLFQIGPLVFTNSHLGALLASIILTAAGLFISRRARLVPGRLQGLLEFPVEFMANIVQGQGGARWRSFLPLIASIFVFILVANWIGILPGVGTIGYYHEVGHVEDAAHAGGEAPEGEAGGEAEGDGAAEGEGEGAGAGDEVVAGGEGEEHGERVLVPFIRPAAADLNFTLGLAIVSFVAFVSWGIRINGVRGYLKELSTPWYLTPIHIISELSRLISLSMRLFGNIFGGEVLLVVIASIAPIAIFAFMGLELVFGLVQALVFALLTMTYITLATAHHGAEERAKGGHGDGESHAVRPEPISPGEATAATGA